MKSVRLLVTVFICALALARPLFGADGASPARLVPASPSGFTDADRKAFVAWALSRPEVRALTAGRRTRVIRVWTDTEKRGADVRRRATVLLRDYDAGVAREISADLPEGRLAIRELVNVPPSEEEIAEGMAIARRDPALAALAADPALRLIGGFHNRSARRDDPCSRDVCLEFAFMRPNYEGPARYVVVDLSRGIVAHHDFRGGRPGEGPPRMTEAPAP
jgi:hypothetical protein